MPPWTTPSLSIEVNRAAQMGAPYALDILEDAAWCTFTLADEAITQLRLNEEDELRVGVRGSAIVKIEMHMRLFARNLKAKYPDAQIIIPDKDAADGACQMAINMAKRR